MHVPLRVSLMVAVLGFHALSACSQTKDHHAEEARSTPPPTLLLSQAQFSKEPDSKGKLRVRPGAARLVILRRFEDGWKPDLLEDPDSNVFHKSVIFTDPTDAEKGPGILTIGANQAMIKLWHRTATGWSARTLWQDSFGGRHDRLRDFELADVTGDGKLDITIATHDQGVVAVLEPTADGWNPIEIDRKPKTFVHEIEVGDLDGDGRNEIYATPSEPNRLDKAQAGWIVAYRHTPGGFERVLVEELTHRHVKEILVADLDGDGRPALFASLEAELGKRANRPADAGRVAVKRYQLENGRYVGRIVATLPDKMCRFLSAGDVDGDGKPELIASTLGSGVWLLRPSPGRWKTELIDKHSAGFEHATALFDFDGDGTLEIYVAADKQRRLRRYRWNAGRWDRQELYEIEDQKITFGVTAGRF